jgi:3-deoxy-manno-octulosonate cytidylyltransferase (CMP-KDO synthetase)
MYTVAIIPARMGSSRFPGKPMAPILGKPMIGHVHDRVGLADSIDLVAVATCDVEIAEYVESIGGYAVMTSDAHERASDRAAEAVDIIERERGVTIECVVMVQGDEPLVHPEMISEATLPMREDDGVQVVNLIGKITDPSDFESRNCIKVVCDVDGNAIYFSREPIPTGAWKPGHPTGKQVCIIPFRRDFLRTYCSLKPTPLEVAESVDMLRVLEYGHKVLMVPTAHLSVAVDSPSDIAIAERALLADDLHRSMEEAR